jgi:hypothetical protein
LLEEFTRHARHVARTTYTSCPGARQKASSSHVRGRNMADDVSNTTEIQAIYKKHRPKSAWYETLGIPDYLGDYINVYYRLHGKLRQSRSRTITSKPHTPRYVPLAIRLTVETGFHPIAGLAGGAFSSVSANGSASPSCLASFSGALILTPRPLPRVSVCSPLISQRASTFPGLASPSVKKRTRIACVGCSFEKVTSPSRQ